MDTLFEFANRWYAAAMHDAEAMHDVRYAMQYPEGPSRRNSHSFVAAFFVNMTNFVGHLSGMVFPVFCFPLHPATLRRCPEQQRVFS